jgi:hypothetical protein
LAFGLIGLEEFALEMEVLGPALTVYRPGRPVSRRGVVSRDIGHRDHGRVVIRGVEADYIPWPYAR